MKIINLCVTWIVWMIMYGYLNCTAFAQTQLPKTPTLDELLHYALENRISIKMAQIGEEIGEKEIAASLSGYYPQLHAAASLDRFLQLPAFVIDGEVIQTGQRNTGIAGAQARQAILSPELMRASRAAKFVRKGYEQQSESEKIDAVVDVSKAYFDILTTEEEINIIRENITRIQRQFDETHARYQVGLVDHTDHDRAQVSLNNVLAELKRASEHRRYKYDYLKQLLGLPFSTPLDLSFHKENLDASILLNDHDVLNEMRRVEYRQLQNTLDLQHLNTRFQRWQFLPVIGAHADYQLNFFSDRFRNLLNGPIPNSNIGLSLSIPVFVGFRRRHEIRKSELMERQLDWGLQDLKNRISAEYSAAISSYAANMAEWKSNKENVTLSKGVYNTIRLQYNQGLKTYLDLMVAETELRASQINYLNALYAVLASKVDLQKAKGDININR